MSDDGARWARLAENARWPERVQHVLPIDEIDGTHSTQLCACSPIVKVVEGEGNLPLARVFEHRVMK